MTVNKAALEADPELFRDLINKTNDAILVADPATGLFIFVNDKACADLGYDRRDLLKMGVMDIETTFPDNFSWQAHVEQLKQRGSLISEGIHKRKTGDTFPVEANVSYVTLNKREYLLAVVRDITERKRAAEALFASEERYRRLFQDSPVSLWEEDITGLQAYIEVLRASGIADLSEYFIEHPEEVFKCVGMVKIVSVNKGTLDLYEAPDQATLLQGLSQVFTSRSLDAFRGILVALSTGAKSYECETVNQTLTGRTIDVLLRWSLIFSEKTDRHRALISIVDITERKRAEEALQLARFTIDNGADAVYWMDSAARIVDVNETACTMLGYTREELLSLTVFDIDPDFTAGKWARSWNALKRQSRRTIETRHRTRDGRDIPVEITANYLSFGGRELDCAFARDITQRKRAEEDMVKTQKLESLGILAGGIAHDFNNILTAILGNISLARMNMTSDEPQFERLEEAERASYHARELTQQLLTFAKGGAPVKKTISVEQLVRDAAGFAVRGSNVRCEFSFGEDLLPVDVDEGQMRQVFNNLVINACQAMPGGGIVKVDARNVDVDPADGMPLAEGKYVKISIEDQGTGIPEEHLQRIFDPYFTTKQKGSGLGLSIVYSVLKNHNAYITVKSKPGEGTAFIIYLPASTEKVAEKELEVEIHGVGKGRVLMMDDEEIVRKIAGDILKEMGYEVEFAPDGDEAIRLYKTAIASSRPFDVVIMDLTVPGGMGGKEAVQKLLEADPGARVIVSSGYSQDPVMANYREYGFCEVIAKPFSSMELGRIIHKAIAGR